MHLNGTAAGLWLVGVGSFLVAAPRLVRAKRPELGLRWESLARRVERVHFATETVGLFLVAAGSLVLAVAELGPWWFVLGVVGAAALGVWVVAALKLRQLWRMRATQARDYGEADPPLVSEAEQRALALAHASWSACLQLAFSPTGPWPPTAGSRTETTGGPERLEPRHIAALHQRDEQLEDAHIPSSLRPTVDGIRAQGFRVQPIGDAIVVTSADGRTAQVQRASVERNSSTAVAARERFIYDCEAIGIEVRTGARGQPHVASGSERLMPDHPVE
jgi:hypothetical protein